jgi:hypothetical protein
MNLELEFTRISVAWEGQEKLACNFTAPYVMWTANPGELRILQAHAIDRSE